jgi:hypothetical protein
MPMPIECSLGSLPSKESPWSVSMIPEEGAALLMTELKSVPRYSNLWSWFRKRPTSYDVICRFAFNFDLPVVETFTNVTYRPKGIL